MLLTGDGKSLIYEMAVFVFQEKKMYTGYGDFLLCFLSMQCSVHSFNTHMDTESSKESLTSFLLVEKDENKLLRNLPSRTLTWLVSLQ